MAAIQALHDFYKFKLPIFFDYRIYIRSKILFLFVHVNRFTQVRADLTVRPQRD